MPTDYAAENARIAQTPEIRAILAGTFTFPGMPFPQPANEHQRVENARAYAAQQGKPIGSGQLNPFSGKLEDPDSGIGRALLAHPEIMIPLVIGGGLGIGALAGPAAASGAAANGITAGAQVNGALDGLAGGVTAATGGAAGGAGGFASTLRNQLTNPRTLLGLGASAVPLVTGGGGNSNPFSGTDEQGLLDEVRQGMALQRKRVEQTQPVFEDLVRRTQASAPNANYGGPAYQYQGPRFGG